MKNLIYNSTNRLLISCLRDFEMSATVKWLKMWLLKVKLISKGNCGVLNFPKKKNNEIILRISALASKNRKIKAH